MGKSLKVKKKHTLQIESEKGIVDPFPDLHWPERQVPTPVTRTPKREIKTKEGNQDQRNISFESPENRKSGK
jgi:hypothetical protein